MNSILDLPPLPLPPSTNKAYADVPFFRNGFRLIKTLKDLFTHVGCNRILSKEGNEYKRMVAQIMNESGYTTKLRDFVNEHTFVTVHIYVHRNKWITAAGLPNRNAGDVDNRVKLLQDILFKCIGIDDAAAFNTCAHKRYGEEDEVYVSFVKFDPARPDETA